MWAPVVCFSLVLIVVALIRLRRWLRHRGDPLMFVTTWPEIEYHQLYGGWDADAYDAGTGRDRERSVPRFLPPGSGIASRAAAHRRGRL
jgi:hypothetical protein